MKEKLKTNKDIIIETGLNLIPYIGGALASSYYGPILEKRLKRLESFYRDVSKQIKGENIVLNFINENKKEELLTLIEDLNDRVETETQEEKIKLFKLYLISSLEQKIETNFDEQKTFLAVLDSMSIIECEILSTILNSTEERQINDYIQKYSEPYSAYGAINRLISYGFLETKRVNYAMNGAFDENLLSAISLSNYGKKFVTYIKMK